MQKLFKVMFIILFLAGAGIFLYPDIADRYYTYQMNKEIKTFTKKSEAIQGSVENDELYQKAKAYNDKIYAEKQSGIVDLPSLEQEAVDLNEYGFEERIFGYIKIPRLDLELPIYLGATDANMGKGIAHLSNTSLPIGGENTHCVLAGHRGMSSAEMLRKIDQLQNGDLIYITNMWETLTYQVVDYEIILPNEIDNIKIVDSKDMLTLVSCHPYPKNTHRYLLHCQRVNGEVKEEPVKAKKIELSEYQIEEQIRFFGKILLVVLICCFIVMRKKKHS